MGTSSLVVANGASRLVRRYDVDVAGRGLHVPVMFALVRAHVALPVRSVVAEAALELLVLGRVAIILNNNKNTHRFNFMMLFVCLFVCLLLLKRKRNEPLPSMVSLFMRLYSTTVSAASWIESKSMSLKLAVGILCCAVKCLVTALRLFERNQHNRHLNRLKPE